MNSLIKLFKIISMLTVMMALTGCLNRYGGIKADFSVNANFESKTVLADHRYYYNGRKSIPYAIVGIHTDYTLNTWGWSPIEPAESQLPKMIERMYQPGLSMPQGGAIFDPDGKQIGVWFSIWRQTAIKMEGENQVNIYSPYNPNRLSEFPRY